MGFGEQEGTRKGIRESIGRCNTTDCESTAMDPETMRVMRWLRTVFIQRWEAAWTASKAKYE